MSDTRFDEAAAQALLTQAFAPWVQDLGLRVGKVGPDGGRFELPENARLGRDMGVVSGQALAAAADTCGVLALSAANGRYRNLTTVDLTTHFMRPVIGPAEIAISILSNGRRMATVRADFRVAGKDKLCAAATCAYAYLED